MCSCVLYICVYGSLFIYEKIYIFWYIKLLEIKATKAWQIRPFCGWGDIVKGLAVHWG